MPYIPTDTDCSELNPGMCGGKMTPTMLDNCDSMYFDGVDNVTINQGVGIDLDEGVTAYDSTGAEIPFEYEPTEIDKCSVGEHEVIYKAIGADERLLPSMCGDNFLSMACSGIGTLIAKRLVTIEQADPPTINGIGTATLSVDEAFDPMNGVTGVDDNGSPVDVTYSGKLADSAEGDIASFETDLTDPLKSLQVFLNPIQDLHGYDSPWVGGAGKNKCDPSRFNRTNNGITFAPTSAQKISITGTATGNAYSGSNATDYASTWVKLKAGTYTVSTNGIASTQRLYVDGYDVNNNPVTTYSTVFGDINKTFTVSSDFGIWYWLYVPNGETVNETVSIQIEQGSTATDWTPYSNICPISGHTEVDVVVSPTTDAEDGTTYTTTLPSTTYGGTLDLISGELTVDRAMVTLDGSQEIGLANWRPNESSVGWLYRAETFSDMWNEHQLLESEVDYIKSDKLPTVKYAAPMGLYDIGTSAISIISGFWSIGVRINDTTITTQDAINSYLASNPIQVCYELATPQTYQLTPQQIQTVLGQNNVWSEDGRVRVIFTKSIPESGEYSYPLDGVYEIEYTAVDECGNEASATREIRVA